MRRRYEQDMQKSINQEIAALQAKVHARSLERERRAPIARGPAVPSSAPQDAVATTEAATNGETLSVTIEDIKTLLEDNTAKLSADFQKTLDKEAQKSLILSIVLSTVFLILGWILSIIASPSLLTHLGSH